MNMDNRAIKTIVGPTILLRSGHYFDFENPEQSIITIDDIAAGLSKICRFTGQCNGFYSVAEHSVLCSYMVPAEDAFAALMHDAAEAVMGDVSRPLKSLLPDYKRIEKRCEAAILSRFGLSATMPASVKTADMQMLAIEQRQAMGNADNWPGIHFDGREPTIKFLLPGQAYTRFRARFDQLYTSPMNQPAGAA